MQISGREGKFGVERNNATHATPSRANQPWEGGANCFLKTGEEGRGVNHLVVCLGGDFKMSCDLTIKTTFFKHKFGLLRAGAFLQFKNMLYKYSLTTSRTKQSSTKVETRPKICSQNRLKLPILHPSLAFLAPTGPPCS